MIVEEAEVVSLSGTVTNETGSGTAATSGASANGPVTTAMLASLAPPPAGSLLRSSSSTSNSVCTRPKSILTL